MNYLATLLKLTVAALLVGTALTSNASLFRLHFNGTSSAGNYQGYIILDYSNPVDFNSSDNQGIYSGIVTESSFEIAGQEFVYVPNAFSFVAVFNDDFDSLVNGDGFGVLLDILNTSTGQTEQLGIQFQDMTGSAFNSDALPTSLNLTDFDAFIPGDTTGFNTGVVLPLSIEPAGEAFVSELSSVSLTQVPVPAGLILMFSAVSGLVGFTRKSK